MKALLNRLTPADQEAFALAGMALMKAVNEGALCVAGQVEKSKSDHAGDLVCVLQNLESAIWDGDSGQLQKAVSKLCALEGVKS